MSQERLFPHLGFAPQAVLLDFNGVLVDDEHLHFLLFRELLEELGLELTQRQYDEDYIALDDEGAFGQALGQVGKPATPQAVDELVQEKARRYAHRAATEAPFYEGAAALLGGLRQAGLPTAIVSGALKPEILFHLGREGHGQGWPPVIVSAEDVRPGKPHPAPYQHALEQLQARHGHLDPGQCLAVEDTAGGVQAATGAGLWTAGVLHTTPAEALLNAGAKKLFPTLQSLLG